mgnify:CR=1 FL=1|jgi:hypothetical protein
MKLADETRIKKRVIRILKANRDAFEAFVSTERGRRLYDSDEEIDYFVKEADLQFALAVARNPNHPLIEMYAEQRSAKHGKLIEAYNGVILNVRLSRPNVDDYQGLVINSSYKTETDARDQILQAREFPARFGGQDAITDAVAVCNQHLYLADSRVIRAILTVSDVQRVDGRISSPDVFESGIIAGAVGLAMRDGADMDIVREHNTFFNNSLRAVSNGATLLPDLA